MPIRPRPFTFTCTCCSWKKTTIPLIDVLDLGRDWFSQCPQCSRAVEMRAATRAELLKTRMEQFLQ